MGKSAKQFLRWVVLGGVLFFLGKALKDNWQAVTTIRLGASGWGMLAIALLITLFAHVWSGGVWGLILRELNQPAGWLWAVRVYLRTNIAKYLPGNVWHFYGRVMAAKQAGVALGSATLSVLLEPLLMAAAALLIALLSLQRLSPLMPLLALGGVLIGIHPRLINPVLAKLKRSKAKDIALDESTPLRLNRYPLLPLLGEVVFLLLRGAGFLLIVAAISPLQPGQVPVLLGAFSFSWLLGLVVPGAPGGLGVFEATAIALLHNTLPTGITLSAVALYRLISTAAEAIGAGLASLGKPPGNAFAETAVKGTEGSDG